MSLFSRNRVSSITKADRARAAGDWREAAQHYADALARNRERPEIWVQYGHALKESDRRIEAEAAYRRAIEVAPTSADAYLHLGHLLKLQDRGDDAETAYLRALALDPSLADARRELAELGLDDQQIPAAQAALPPLPRRRRRASVITLADGTRELGRWQEADRLYREALARNPHNAPIWVQHGHMLGQMGDLAAAEVAYRRALACDPKSADIYLQLGHVLKAQGKTAQAQSAYLRSFALDPTQSGSIEQIGSLGWSAANLRELERTSADLSDRHGAVASDNPLLPSVREFRILYVSGADNIASHAYRVENYIDALATQSIDALWISVDRCKDNIQLLHDISLVVFWRAAYVPEKMDEFLQKAKQLGVPTVFDVDDYVFEPKIATTEYIDGIRFVPAHELDNYYWGVRAYRAMLFRCQFATFTTKFLVERGEELGRHSFHLPNGLDRNYRDAKHRDWRAVPSSKVVIGYTPGTRTHQRDIRVASPAIGRVLAENPDAVLRIIGDFDISEVEEWRSIGHQIEHDPTIGRSYVREKTLEFDINIAPVEIGNPFTEAKSELKYFEPGALAVPTIASATAVFRDAIRDGKTGFLASTTDDWYRALTALVRDFDLRKRIGEAAHKDATSTYGLEAIGETARKVYGQIISDHRHGLGRSTRTMTVTMLMVEPFRGSGGHAKAMSLMCGLADRGHDVAIHFIDSLGEFDEPGDVRVGFGLPDTVEISCGPDVPRPCDVAVATFWKTAHFLKQSPRFAEVSAYFMQDYEPLFYPMSDEYIGAQRSYQLGLRNISYGPWIRDYIKRELNADAEAIPFFIDKSKFNVDPAVPRATDRLVLFGRPEMPRRLWHLTVSGIKQFLDESGFSGVVEIFGSNAGADIPFPCVMHGVISPSDMAALFRQGTLGIAISSTNPSMVPFEMMACGMPVVDIDLNNSAVSYGGRDNIFLAEPTQEGLAATLAATMANEPARRAVAENALAFIAQMADYDQAVKAFEQLLLRSLNRPS